jgi:hypothetical protein
MLKNESAQNPTKPTPLRPARFPDSGGIIFMSNGVRMEKISRSDRKVKQAKKMLTGQGTCQSVQLTWQVRTLTRGRFRTGHVAGSGECHVSGRFGTFGTRLGQSEGDTCHHWKGDTWHG